VLPISTMRPVLLGCPLPRSPYARLAGVRDLSPLPPCPDRLELSPPISAPAAGPVIGLHMFSCLPNAGRLEEGALCATVLPFCANIEAIADSSRVRLLDRLPVGPMALCRCSLGSNLPQERSVTRMWNPV
jgi:hypothetical protein